MPSLRHCYSNITRIFKSLGAVSVDTRVARGSDLGLSGLGAYVAMKHDYFIEDLGQAAGWFKPHRYRYSCLRCAWSFVVEDGRGKVTALDEFDRPMPEPLSGERVQTFVDGPCVPSWETVARPHPAIKKFVVRNLRPVRREQVNAVSPGLSAK
jgi:hypothetical protein